MAIINGKYSPLPPNSQLSCFNDLIKGCLQVSPVQRLTTSAILEQLAAIAESNGFDPREPANIEISTTQKVLPPTRPAPPTPSPTATQSNIGVSPARPAPPVPSSQPPPRPSPPQMQSQKNLGHQSSGKNNDFFF